MNIFVWTAEKPAKYLWSDQIIHRSAIPARVIVLKNSFQPTHPCPALLKTACPVWETPPAAGHRPATPVAQGPAVAAEKIWTRRKETAEPKDRITVHVNMDVSTRMPAQMASLFLRKEKASQKPGKLHLKKSSVFWKHFRRKTPIVLNWRWVHYILR
jgi:hypothetical protein